MKDLMDCSQETGKGPMGKLYRFPLFSWFSRSSFILHDLSDVIVSNIFSFCSMGIEEGWFGRVMNCESGTMVVLVYTFCRDLNFEHYNIHFLNQMIVE